MASVIFASILFTISWFTGDNDLETFGEQLVPFGTAMKNYSLAVTGLDASVVTNSANAAKALVELSNNLPNSGGIVSWFTGDNDIASFGEQLVSFGQSFAAYYNSVSGVDVAKLSGVVVEFRNLVDLANGIKAKACVCGQRENEYGSPEDNFTAIAGFWSVYKGVEFTANDVAMMMALLKIARIRTGTATDDSYVDLAGYAACGAEINSKN